MKTPLAAALLVLVLALPALSLGCRSGGFVATLPSALPDLRAWEKSSGRLEFDTPRRLLEYELYVRPERPGVYSVTRYRITSSPAPGRVRTSEAEKLQWDEDGRTLHRYECVPEKSRSCLWREFQKGSAEYDGELRSLLAVYGLHSSLLRDRDEKRGK